MSDNDLPTVINMTSQTTKESPQQYGTFQKEDLAMTILEPKSCKASDFPQFSDLPAELRVRIWEFSMPDARTLEIQWVGSEYHYTDKSLTHFRSKNPNPILLAVSQESRAETLRKYKMVRGRRGFCLAFNPNKDTIYESKAIIAALDSPDRPEFPPQQNWWHWAPCNLLSFSCTPGSKIRYLAIHHTRLAEIIARVRDSREPLHWDELDEIKIVARATEDHVGIRQPEGEKELVFGEMVPENSKWRWGKPRLINSFMRILMALHEVSGRAPVVKIVRDVEVEKSPSYC